MSEVKDEMVAALDDGPDTELEEEKIFGNAGSLEGLRMEEAMEVDGMGWAEEVVTVIWVVKQLLVTGAEILAISDGDGKDGKPDAEIDGGFGSSCISKIDSSKKEISAALRLGLEDGGGRDGVPPQLDQL